MGRLILTLALITGLAAGCTPGGRQVTEQALLDPSERAVRLETEGCGFASPRSGSGIAVGGGLVVTTAHVVVEAEAVVARVNGVEHRSVPVVAVDRQRDLAVLRVPYEELPAIEMTAMKKSDRGSIVGAASSGTVAFEVRGVVELTIEEVFGTERYSRSGYELSASTADGDSGAGAYDDEGRLIGIVFATGEDGTTTWVTASSEIEEFLSQVEPSDTYPLCNR
jgi:S1-C subfamily serine protease